MTKNIIHGSGGGKGGGSSRVAVEDPNTLQSKSIVTIVDVLSEGEILGLYGYEEGIPEKGIYLNDTPLIAESGLHTYDGVSTEIRYGAPDQEVIPDIPVEAEIDVNAEVTHDYPKNSGEGSGAITRTITNPNVTAARVKIRVSGLTEQDKSNGDLHGYKVSIAIAVNGVIVVTNEIDGKTTSVYERAYKIPLTGDGPWNITVHRLSDDNDSANTNNDTTWASYTEIVEAKMVYPDTALVMLRGDAATFGNSVPTRKYLVYGQKCQVPVNYDPTTREYTGLWNGTFKEAWTDNPAWVYYDILTNDRYGVGKEVNLTEDTKFDLYLIAQYCDQMVDDGFGGTEPRFTFNYHITSREEALDCLRAIASTFRGFAFWAAGSVFVRADMPTDPKRLVTASNVIDGEFHYASTAYSSRHSVAIVAWNDPDNLYEVAREVVEDPDLIEKYGWKPLEITAYGCTSRGQANRLGKWNLYTEQFENETVTYTCGEDHFDIIPGDIISIADPTYMNVRRGGRLRANSLTEVVLDNPIEIEAGESYSIHITMPDYEIEQRTITNGVGEHSVLTLDTPLSGMPLDNAEWIITSTDLAPRQFRVLSKTENSDDGTYSITALYYNPNKFAMVEEGLTFDPIPYSRPDKDKLKPPTDLSLVESSYWSNGLPKQRLTVSWTPSTDIMTNGYVVQIQPPAGIWDNIEVGLVPSVDINIVDEGFHVVRVQSFASDGRRSDWLYGNIIINGKNIPPGKCTNLVATGGLKSVSLVWQNPDDTDLQYIHVYRNDSDDLTTATKVASVKGTSYTDGGLGGLETYYYWLQAQDLSGNLGDYNSNMGTSATTTQVSHDDLADQIIEQSNLIPSLLEPIEKIPLIETDITNMDLRVGDIESEIPDAIQRLSDRVSEINDDVMGQLSEVSASAVDALLNISEIGQRITDAGITVDPEDGTVSIWAVDQMRNEYDLRLSEAQILIDAMESSINSKVTLAEVDERIVQATFGDVGELLLSGVNARITSVEEDLNAVEGTLTEKASVVDVDVIGGRVTSAESRLNGAEASIALKADQIEVDGLGTRVTSAEQNIDAIEGTISSSITAIGKEGVDLANLTADALTEEILNNADNRKHANLKLATAKQELNAHIDEGIASEASARLALQAIVDDNTSQIVQEQTARSTADESMANDIATLVTKSGNNTTAIQEEKDVRANETESLGRYTFTSLSEYGNATGDGLVEEILNGVTSRSLIKEERITRSTEDEALAYQIETLQAELGENTALIQSEQTARVTADAALASDITNLQVSVEGNTSAVSTTAEAISDVSGNVDAIYEVKTQVETDGQRYVGGFGLRTDETGTEFGVLADRFFIAQPDQTGGVKSAPFVIGTVDGSPRISMSNAFIQDASIDSANIVNGAITNAKIDDAAIDNANIQDLTISRLKLASGLNAGFSWGCSSFSNTQQTYLGGTVGWTTPAGGFIYIKTESRGRALITGFVRCSYWHGSIEAALFVNGRKTQAMGGPSGGASAPANSLIAFYVDETPNNGYSSYKIKVNGEGEACYVWQCGISVVSFFR